MWQLTVRNKSETDLRPPKRLLFVTFKGQYPSLPIGGSVLKRTCSSVQATGGIVHTLVKSDRTRKETRKNKRSNWEDLWSMNWCFKLHQTPLNNSRVWVLFFFSFLSPNLRKRNRRKIKNKLHENWQNVKVLLLKLTWGTEEGKQADLSKTMPKKRKRKERKNSHKLGHK